MDSRLAEYARTVAQTGALGTMEKQVVMSLLQVATASPEARGAALASLRELLDSIEQCEVAA